jgi:hypothetical protein
VVDQVYAFGSRQSRSAKNRPRAFFAKRSQFSWRGRSGASRAEAGEETPRDLGWFAGQAERLLVSSAGYLSALIFADYRIGAWLAGRIGRRNLFLIFSIGVIAIVLIYTQLKLPNRALWVLSVSARLFCLRLFLRHGCLPDRIISDTVAPLRPRFLL